MKDLLRTLAAKYLTQEEIIGAYAKRGTRIFNGLLEVRQEHQVERKRKIYTCGSNPHFVATTVVVP